MLCLTSKSSAATRGKWPRGGQARSGTALAVLTIAIWMTGLDVRPLLGTGVIDGRS